MKQQACDKQIEIMQEEIVKLTRLVDLYGPGKGYEEKIDSIYQELEIFSLISNLKELKSLIQKLEYIVIQEYENDPALSSLISIVNATSKNESYTSAFKISKGIANSIKKDKNDLFREIKSIMKEIKLR